MRERTNPLDRLEIASPCSADWDKMFGSERKRFCAGCRLNVYNIAEMTQLDAENLILRSEGRLCLRLYKRADGTVITKNCPVGWARVKRRMTRVSGAVAGLLGGFLMGVLGLGALRGLDEMIGEEERGRVIQPEGVGISFGMGSPETLQSIGVDILTSRFGD